MKKEDLNKVIIKTTKRPDGSIRIQQDFSNCPTLTEQHTAHLTDINYLIEKYRPDELAAYLAARETFRSEIIGHDFSVEPDLQESKNHVYQLKKAYEELSDEIKAQFRSPAEWYKFIDNPANQEKLIKMGFLKPKEVEEINQTLGNKPPTPGAAAPSPTQSA